MVIKKFTTAWVLSLCLAGNAIGAGDDVIESINEGMDYYKEGEYTEAASSLNYAVQLIQQKKGEALSGLLPEPLDGWTASEVQSQAAGAAMFGGGVTAEREYSKGNSSISVSIMSDSPLLQSVMIMFSNPMFATADGGKMERINRQKAIVNYSSADKTGELQMVVAKRFLVTINGDNISRDELLGYASAIDVKKMAALP